jgi:hypothetical protein
MRASARDGPLLPRPRFRLPSKKGFPFPESVQPPFAFCNDLDSVLSGSVGDDDEVHQRRACARSHLAIGQNSQAVGQSWKGVAQAAAQPCLLNFQRHRCSINTPNAALPGQCQKENGDNSETASGATHISFVSSDPKNLSFNQYL